MHLELQRAEFLRHSQGIDELMDHVGIIRVSRSGGVGGRGVCGGRDNGEQAEYHDQ